MKILFSTRSLRGIWASLAVLTIVFDPGTALAESDAERGLALATRWCNSCHLVQQNDPGMDDGEWSAFRNFDPVYSADAQEALCRRSRRHGCSLRAQ